MTDFFGRDLFTGHFPASLGLIVAFYPQDDRHEVVQSRLVIHHRLVLQVVTVTKLVFDRFVGLTIDSARGF